MINLETKNLFVEFEDIRLKPYLCQAGVPTIGIGSTRYADGRKVKLSDKPLTTQKVWELFYITLKEYADAVSKYVTHPLNENQYGALVSLVYNIGVPNFIVSTLLKKLNKGDLLGASEEFKRWNKVKGKLSNGLTRRREAERKLFLKAI